jgi:hypothetical protein
MFSVVRAVTIAMQHAIHAANNSGAVFSVVRGQLSVEDSRGKLVVEEELEVSL